MDGTWSASQGALLRRSGLVFPPSGQVRLDARLLDAVALELAQLGYVPSARLRMRMETLPRDEAAGFRDWLCGTLAAKLGADQEHEPLFRKFPDGVPGDTAALWWRRVLVHYLQGSDQQCLFCLQAGTTHVLNPCEHVICDHCFDGENYSACPVCNRRVDRSSPFFEPSTDRPLPKEQVRFKVLELGDSYEEAAKGLFLGFCERTQAMSPEDRSDLEALVRDFPDALPRWLPETMPVKENIALVFGTLFQMCPPGAVLEVATPYLKTATDVLRVLAAYSGADPALQGETIHRNVAVEEGDGWRDRVARLFGLRDPGPHLFPAQVPVKVFRFKLAKVSRPLRRAIFALLEGLDPDLLVEDMLRHRSYWVWIGELLHPHEYATRFPHVARAFAIVRKKSPTGEKAPRFRTFHSKVEEALARQEVGRALQLLRERPGELGRRLDHALRIAGANTTTVDTVVEEFEQVAPELPTPMLLTLRNHFPSRTSPAPVRVYWPKGGTAGGQTSPDVRSALGQSAIDKIVAIVESVILERFSALTAAPIWIVDRALESIMVPFNERTASPGAIPLPRGSTIRAPIPPEKCVRLFLHWCEPEDGGMTTDLDLSVGFYGDNWEYKGVCSYYQLKCKVGASRLAISSGDLTSAPFPAGSSEFVDVDTKAAREAGVRYAVMLVTSYSGMAFSRLHRAFAGYMVREDMGGKHFDPRTVEMKFALQGEKGVFVPVIFDLVEDRLHWVDVYSKGMLALNNVETSNKEIQCICPDMVRYFASGVRMSMYELALLHAASRAREVFVRGTETRRFERAPGESSATFLKRLLHDEGQSSEVAGLSRHPEVTAFLLRGDLELAEQTSRYVLFPETIAGTTAAADWLG